MANAVDKPPRHGSSIERMTQTTFNKLGIVLSLLWLTCAQGAPVTPFDNAATACGNAANSAHDCAIQIKVAIPSATTTDQLARLSQLWNDRYQSAVVQLRGSAVGLVKAKSDMELIREEIAGEVEGVLKDKVKEEIAQKTIPASWRSAWDTFWSKYFKRVSVFLNHPVAKATMAALKASMPSQTATSFDELGLTNKGVTDLLWQRAQILQPPPSFLETATRDAYDAVGRKLVPQLTAGPTLDRR